MARRALIASLVALIVLMVLVVITALMPSRVYAGTDPDMQVQPGVMRYTLIVTRCKMHPSGAVGCMADAGPTFWARRADCEEIAASASRILGGSRVLLIDAECKSFEVPAQ